MMSKRARRRFGWIVLVLVFSISNIGLPMVLATCPMATQMGKVSSCCQQTRSGESEKQGIVLSTSCCKSTLVGVRNTSEFLRTELQILGSSHLLSAAPIPDYQHLLNARLLWIERDHFPFGSILWSDTPVLHSSLLL